MSKQLINFEKAVAMAAEIIAPRWDFTYEPPYGSSCVNYTSEGVKRVPSCVIGCIIHKNAPDRFERIGLTDGASASIPTAFPRDKFIVTERAGHFFGLLQVKQDSSQKAWGRCFVEAVAETNANSWHLSDTEAY